MAVVRVMVSLDLSKEEPDVGSWPVTTALSLLGPLTVMLTPWPRLRLASPRVMPT